MIYFLQMVVLSVVITLLLYLAWIGVPILYGLPWVPTRKERIRKALEMADIHPGNVVYDLGAGDGRVLLSAIQDFGAARGVGIEISPAHCAVGHIRALLRGIKPKVQMRRENFYRADIRDADVVFLYMTSGIVARLQSHLEEQLKPGARVVSIAFDFPDWQPTNFDDNLLIFSYEMPPQPGGLIAYLAKKA